MSRDPALTLLTDSLAEQAARRRQDPAAERRARQRRQVATDLLLAVAALARYPRPVARLLRAAARVGLPLLLLLAGCPRTPAALPEPSQADCERAARESDPAQHDLLAMRCQQALWQEGCLIDDSPCARGMCRMVRRMRGLSPAEWRALPPGWAYLPECALPEATRPGGEI